MERLFNLDWQLFADSAIMMVSILILFVLLSFLLFNPVRKMLAARKERVAGELDEAARNRAEARALREEYEGKLAAVRTESDAILEDARKRGKANEAQIIEQAHEEAAGIVSEAKREAELVWRNAAARVKTDMVDVAAAMTAQVIGEQMTPEIQDSLVDETLEKLGATAWLG